MMRELVPRAARVREAAGIPAGDPAGLARWALKFILANPAVSTVIPGARNPEQAEKNVGASEDEPLPKEQVEAVRKLWKEDSLLRDLRTEL
jgi:aryl-alcohol dehydrogenase-like predicted oxidoreductase